MGISRQASRHWTNRPPGTPQGEDSELEFELEERSKPWYRRRRTWRLGVPLFVMLFFLCLGVGFVVLGKHKARYAVLRRAAASALRCALLGWVYANTPRPHAACIGGLLAPCLRSSPRSALHTAGAWPREQES